MRQMVTLLGLKVMFFQRVQFLEGPFFLRSSVGVRIRFLDDAQCSVVFVEKERICQ